MKVQHIEFDSHSPVAHYQSAEQFKSYARRFWHFKSLVQSDLFQSGDACRHPVQSSDVVGQGGNQ